MSNHRYNDYYLVNDEDMDIEESIEYRAQEKCRPRKIIYTLLIILTILAIIAFILIFVVFPIIFQYSVSLQQNLVFTHFNLETRRTFFENFHFPGLKNHYVPVTDIDDSSKRLTLGLWHILPLELAENSLNDTSYDYNAALKNSKYSVLLYFHGTGEDRSQSSRKYQSLRNFFHIIVFDYRSYADSSKGQLFERNVVHDCVQIYKWLQNQTDSPIYVWGHSLGTALATSTLSHLGNSSNATGLVLEAPFTTFKEELYHHPIVKYFKWLPWFERTVVNPLQANGFIFNTSKHILDVKCPIMFLHAEDDEIVPYYMSKNLYEISEKRHVDEKIKNETTLILFKKVLRLNHNFIYVDPYVILYVHEFLKRSSSDIFNIFKGSHQS